VNENNSPLSQLKSVITLGLTKTNKQELIFNILYTSEYIFYSVQKFYNLPIPYLI